jgi:tetratricopeptide (TPR) repeat protein
MAQDAQDVPRKIAALEQQVQKLLQEQKPQLAIPVLSEIVLLDPKNLNGQANLGVLLCFQGNYAEAAPHLRTAIEMKPDLWRIEALLGIAEKRTGNPRDAQIHLERAFSNLDDQKIRIEAGLELVEIHSAGAQFERALSVAGKLQELAPQDPQILLVTYELSRQMMDQSLLTMLVSAPESAEMHMIMAGELGRQGDHPSSVAQYREALKLNPTLPGAHFELAEQLRTSSDPEFNAQAEDEYKAAIKVNQNDALAWRQLGGIMSAKGDFKAAEEDYRKALAIQPRDSDAKTGLAIVLISTDKTDDAISLLESAVKDDPTNLVAHFRLSTLYRRAGREADAQRELDTFNHYQDVKGKLGKVFKQLAGPLGPM